MLKKKIISLILCLCVLGGGISSYAITPNNINKENTFSENETNGITPYWVACSCGGRFVTITWFEYSGIRACVYGEVSYDQYYQKLQAPKCDSCSNRGRIDLLGKGNYCRHYNKYY